MARVYTKEEIITLLDTNDKAVVRALVRIYERQTAAEQSAEQTTDANGVGFNGPDSRILTYRAKYAIRTGSLSGNHLTDTRERIKKYWKQLLSVANSQSV